LPTADVQIVEEPGISSDLMAELASLLTEFARDAIPDVMEAQKILEVDGEVPTEAKAEETVASSDEKVEEIAPRPVTLGEALDCMERVAEFMQVNSESRGLTRFVDVSIEMQSELDKTVTKSPPTSNDTASPKITTVPEANGRPEREEERSRGREKRAGNVRVQPVL
jgi:hypothetical protein